MKLNQYFTDYEIENAKKFLYEFHDKILVDNRLSGVDVLLLCIYMCANKQKTAYVEYKDVAGLFAALGRKAKSFPVYVHRAIEANLIDKFKLSGKTILTLTVKGLKRVKDLLGSEMGVKTWIIKSGKPYTEKRHFQDAILSELKGLIKICDPYCGLRTLDLLSNIKSECEILFLTQIIENEKKFLRDLKDFEKEFPHIKIKIKIHKGRKLHDRYMICDEKCWIIGQSLKDIGKKDAIIIELEKLQALNEIFDKRWNEATILSDYLKS